MRRLQLFLEIAWRQHYGKRITVRHAWEIASAFYRRPGTRPHPEDSGGEQR